MERTAGQAEKINKALHEGIKGLAEYREIRGWVNNLQSDLLQLTKLMELETLGEEMEER